MANLDPIRCPRCNKRYRLPASFNNRQVVCKRCQHQFRVDNPEGADQASASSDSPAVGSLFDSLDVDDLLNAPSSGLEKARLRQQAQNHVTEDRDPQSNTAPSTDSPSSSKQTKKGRKKKKQTQPDPVPVTNDPDPDLIEEELEFAWAKKREQQKEEREARNAAASIDADGQSNEQKEPELDEEELAIYAAVTRQNRRWNILWGLVVAIAAVLIGGYFANLEYENLSKPLTADQRDWLTDRGFVLKASHITRAIGGKGAAVTVAAGKSFADIDKFPVAVADVDGSGAINNGDGQRVANANGRQGWQRNQKDGRKREGKGGNGRRDAPLVPVDFDTNVDLSQLETKPNGAAESVSVFSPLVSTYSPRGYFYAAGARFIIGVSARGGVFEQRTLELPSGQATAIVATADGRRVIVGGEAGLVQSYQLDALGRLTSAWTLRRVHRDKIIRLIASDDSKQLIVYSADGRMTIWNLENQSIELNISDLVPEQRLLSLRLTRDAVLIGSSEGVRKVLLGESSVDLESFGEQYRLLAPDLSAEKIIFSDGKRFGAIDATTKIGIWDASMRIDDEAHVEFSPDRQTGFYYDRGRDVIHFDLSTGRILNRFGDDRLQHVRDATVSSDGMTLLVEGDKNQLLVFSIEGVNGVPEPQLLKPLPVPERNYPPVVAEGEVNVNLVATANLDSKDVTAMCLSDNGFLIAAAGRANSQRLIVFDWTTQRIVDEKFEDVDDAMTFMTTIGNRLVVGRESGMVETSEIDLGGKLRKLRRIAGQLDRIIYIAPIPDSPHVVSVSDSGHTRVWDLETGEAVYDGRPLEPRVQSAAIDRRSNVLLADGDELVTLVYKSGTVKRKKGNMRVKNVTLLPDGKRLAFFDRKKLKLATTSRGEINLSIDLPSKVTSVSFSPDSKLAFLFAGDRAIVYRLRGGKELFSFAVAAKAKTTKMVFSADGKFMVPFSPKKNGNFRIYATPQQ